MSKIYANTGLLTSDTTVKASPGQMKSIVIAWRGCAVGEYVSLVNHASNNTPALATFVYATANGTITFEWSGDGLQFDTAIRVNIGPTGGTVYVSGQFD